MIFSLNPLHRLFPNHYRQYRSQQGLKAENQGIAALKRTAPRGIIVEKARTNRKDIDLWIIQKDRAGKLLKQPFQWKDVSSYGPIRKSLKKAPNVPVLVTNDCMKKMERKRK